MGSFIVVIRLIFKTQSWIFAIRSNPVVVEPCDLCFTALVDNTPGSSETHALALEFEVHK